MSFAVPAEANQRSAIVAAASRRPLLTGALTAAALTTIVVVAEIATGRMAFALGRDEGIAKDFRIAILHCLLIGYIVGAMLSTRNRTRRALPQVRDTVDDSQRMVVIALTLGILFSFAGPVLSSDGLSDSWIPDTWSIELFWHRSLGLILGPLAMLLTFVLIGESSRMSKAAPADVNIFALEPFTAFARYGLSNALVVMGLASLLSLFVFDQGITVLVIILWIINATLAVCVAYLPMRGLRRSIRERKRRELGWAATEIANERNRLSEGVSNGRLADLVAYRGEVERVREWPIDIATYARLATYLILPLLSWVFSRVVDVVLNQLFG